MLGDLLSDVLAMVTSLVSAEVLVAVGLVSGAFFVGTLIVIPVILVRLPANYFDERYPRSWMRDHHPVLRLIAHLAKNLVGGVFLLAGIAMLVLPGQGLLTILIGVSLLDFPGKRRMEARLVGQRTVLRAINAMRARYGRPPLTIAPREHQDNLSEVRSQPSASAD